MKMACKDCRYWREETGLCRRFPPSRDGFPRVEPDCWCYCFEGKQYIPKPPPKPRDPVPELRSPRNRKPYPWKDFF